MKALVCKHLGFIPASQFKEWDDEPKAILIYPSRINGRNYKNKREVIGKVTPYTDRKKGKQWCYCQADVNLEADSVCIISDFLERMNDGRIKFNPEKGELELL